MAPSRDPLHVSILVYEGCDLLDAGGPYEVFLTASRLAERDGRPRPFITDVVSVDGEPVTAFGGLGLVPTAPPSILERSDLVIVPGTIDLAPPLDDRDLLTTVAAAVQRADVTVASVCTGAFLLGEVGALESHAWTTHWEDIELLSERTGSDGVRGVRWVDSGAIVSSGGLSSGIAMSLHLVARFAGIELAQRTARQLDYDWTETSVVP